MRTVILFTLSFLLGFQTVFCQTYEMKKVLTDNEKLKLVEISKEVFENEIAFNFSITTSDVVTSLSKLKDQEKYDEAYLEKQKTALEKDPQNPYTLNNIGNYFNFHQEPDSASFYFDRSLKCLDISKFKGDSASYYSFRGILKQNLNLENAIGDIEYALKLNPTDSIAITFYPVFLLGKGEYKK